jgi:hypothetical protein
VRWVGQSVWHATKTCETGRAGSRPIEWQRESSADREPYLAHAPNGTFAKRVRRLDRVVTRSCRLATALFEGL